MSTHSTITCAHCGTEFVKRTMWHKFCSDTCSKAYALGYNAESLPNCVHCGDPIQPRHEKMGRKRRYCSDLCRSDVARGRPVRSPALRKAAQRAYLAGLPFSVTEYTNQPNAMPEVDEDEAIGWDDIKADIRSGWGRRDDRKRYGYQKGDWGVSNSVS